MPETTEYEDLGPSPQGHSRIRIGNKIYLQIGTTTTPEPQDKPQNTEEGPDKENEILPCKYCGEPPAVEDRGEIIHIHCDCHEGLGIMHTATHDEPGGRMGAAIREWNKHNKKPQEPQEQAEEPGKEPKEEKFNCIVLRCRFCGTAPQLDIIPDGWALSCPRCDVATCVTATTQREVARMWNQYNEKLEEGKTEQEALFMMIEESKEHALELQRRISKLEEKYEPSLTGKIRLNEVQELEITNGLVTAVSYKPLPED